MRIVSRMLRKLGACFHTPPPVSFEERRLQPVSRLFGFDRGMPLDRYYIEKFLQEHSSCITGEVLEVADDGYTRKFGHNVVPHVLHVDSSSRGATITGDLSKPETLPEGIAGCFICTQTFNFIYDLERAVQGAHRLLWGGGIAGDGERHIPGQPVRHGPLGGLLAFYGFVGPKTVYGAFS